MCVSLLLFPFFLVRRLCLSVFARACVFLCLSVFVGGRLRLSFSVNVWQCLCVPVRAGLWLFVSVRACL